MTVRRALEVLAVGMAALAMSPAVLAQQGDGEQVIIAPAEPLGEAPEPALNPVAESDLGAYQKCMFFFYGAEGDEPSFDSATQEAGCTNIIELGSVSQRAAAYYARAQIRRRDGRNEQALEDLDALIALDPRDVFPIQNRASLHSAMGRHDLAREDLMTALKIEPLNPSAHNSMCWMLAMEEKDLDRALSYCNISIGLMTNNAAALDSRGMVYLKMGKYDLALADYKRAMAIAPDNAHFMYGRGMVLLRLGRAEEGKRLIDRAVAADPTIAKQYEEYGVKP